MEMEPRESRSEPDRAEEARLVAAAVAGEDAAREAIVRMNEALVYNLALRLMRDPERASVVFQQTFLKVFQALPRFRARSSLHTWIYRIATREALQILRRDRARVFEPIDTVEADPSADLSETARALARGPDALLEDEELRRRLREAIDRLPPKHRAAFVLVDMQGLSLREAAAAAGSKVSALKTDLRRARLFLRDALSDYLGRKDV